MANTWTDDQQYRDAIAATHVLALHVPATKQADHGAGETCAQVINRLGRGGSSIDVARHYVHQDVTKHGQGAIRALRSGLAIRTLSTSHADGNELCVVTICRVAGIPF